MEKMNDIAKTIAQDLGVDFPDNTPEELILEMIASKVLDYLEHDTELLMSYLYRLDVDEEKVEKALSFKEEKPPHRAIAELIFERQLERAKTKRDMKQKPIEGWEMW